MGGILSGLNSGISSNPIVNAVGYGTNVFSQFWDDLTSGHATSDLWYNGLFAQESPSQVSALYAQCQSEITQAGGTPTDVAQCVSDINNSLNQSGAQPTALSPTEVLVIGALIIVGILFLTRR